MCVYFIELITLKNQLANYIANAHVDERFSNLNRIDELSQRMVKTKKHSIYQLVHLLLKLALILFVTTTTVESIFLVIKLIKKMICKIK